jgi:short-subunit dehydrogenase
MSASWVVITGASSGIGAEFAKLFAADGHPIVLIARREDRLRELAKTLPVETRICVQDLSTPDAAERVEQFLVNEGVEPGVLVNNAGFGVRGRFLDEDRVRQLAMIQLNVATLVDLTYRLLPKCKGGVINVASLAAFQPGPYMAVYFATKAFVLHFSEAIREETGANVTAFCPGPVATEFGDVAGLGNPAAYSWWTLTAEKATKIGYRGFRKGRAIVIPGVIARISNTLNWLVPRAAVRKIVGTLQKPNP